MNLKFIHILNNIFSIKTNKLFFLFIVIIGLINSSIIKIPFKILKLNIFKTDSKEKQIDNMTFYIKLISLIELGKPLQKIETIFDLRESNFYITNYCYDCSYTYLYNKSTTFYKAERGKNQKNIENSFYAYESFYFNDGFNNEKKEVKDMLIYLPILNNKNNILNIGLKFPYNINNNFQETFIQQLRHKNIINKYFWIMIFNDNNKHNKEYDGEFIFGDIVNDYYAYFKDYNSEKIVKIYTGNKKINSKEDIDLEWGILFDEVYYELPKKNENININKKSNIVNINNLMSEFDFNLNIIYGTYEYTRNIQRDYFNIYFIKNICQLTYMRGSIYKYIYCYSSNFTQNDLEAFPTLYFKIKELRFIFSLNYKDLFYLTEDKKYYIFNIMMINFYNYENINNDELDGVRWIFGLPFWKKYQFSFDTDNKLIYYYNKNGNFKDETKFLLF